MELVAFARVDLGLSEAEFWRLTPAQFFAMSDRLSERIRREDRRVGILTAVIRGCVGAKNVGIWDYFPEHKDEKRGSSESPEQVRQNFEALIRLQEDRGIK